MSTSLTAGKANLVDINRQIENCLPGHLGICITAVGNSWLSGEMPVNDRTRQPFGILHGGASVVLAETLGSFAATLIVQQQGKQAVGIEVNANHLRSVTSGIVSGVCRADHIGNSLHVWSTRIQREDGRLICVARLTVSIIPSLRGNA